MRLFISRSLCAIALLAPSASWSGSIPSPALKLNDTDRELKEGYQTFLKTYNQQMCGQSTQDTYEKLFREYRALGFYIPDFEDGELDLKTVEKHLPLLQKKLQWIGEQKKKVAAIKNWPNGRDLAAPLQKTIDELLQIKGQYYLEGNNKSELVKKSRQKLRQLSGQFEALMQQLSFLQSFGYPVDHFAHRKEHEKHKPRKTRDQERRANELFFVRKIHEDGALDKNRTRSDIYLRTTLDTVSLGLKRSQDWLREDTRYDLEWVLGRIAKQLRRGKNKQLERLSEWQSRTKDTLDFYSGLTPKGKNAATLKQAESKSRATRDLRQFVYTQNAKAYKYMTKQPEEIRALYVLDQILLNEAGRATVYNYQDRKDIAQVVINRRFHPELSKLEANETLASFLTKQSITPSIISKYPWLNVMFKEEQFSFTLYFIPAVQHVFCPDFYHVARTTRAKNLTLSLMMLRQPKGDFKALRYFSRFSMVGKIDMSEIWSEFHSIPERPGRKLKNIKALQQALRSGKFRYLYPFTDNSGEQLHVVEIKGTNYVLAGSVKKPVFYNHRDPHKFTYFEPKADGLMAGGNEKTNP